MSDQDPKQGRPPQDMGPPPDPSFQSVVDTFAVPALIWTGHIQPPGEERFEPNLDMAQYQIGMLEILEEKTKGNLGTEEEEYIEGILHNVRIAYMRTQEALGRTAAGEGEPQVESPKPETGGEPSGPQEVKPEERNVRESKKYNL